MKAVILTGAEWPRLHPLTIERPKELLPLFGRPLLEHTLNWLRGNGVSQAAIAPRGPAGPLKRRFGAGEGLDLALEWLEPGEDHAERIWTWAGGETLLLLRQPVICDFLLDGALDFHRSRQSVATLLLYRHPDPLEHHLILTEPDGRVRQAVTCPGWNQTAGNTVDTGIRILAPERLSPQLGGALLGEPAALNRLLQAERAVYACAPRGYWRDIRDCGAYLHCVEDCLDGRAHLDLGLPEVLPGVWAAAPMPGGVQPVPPCWIGRGVKVGAGSLIGPHVMLEQETEVGPRCRIQRSAVLGAEIREESVLSGAVADRNASARRHSVLNEGAVLGAGAIVEEGAMLVEGIRVWPGQKVPGRTRLLRSLKDGRAPLPLLFAGEGLLQGVIGEELQPEQMAALGGVLGELGRVGLGHAGGQEAAGLARALAGGAAAVGGQILFHGLGFPAGAAWVSGARRLAVSAFVEQDRERAIVYLFDHEGLPLTWERTMELENALRHKAHARPAAGRAASEARWNEAEREYCARAAEDASACSLTDRPPTISIPRDDPANRALQHTLLRLGCRVIPEERENAPALFASRSGFSLHARDETGQLLQPERVLTMVCQLELEAGAGRVAVSACAPAAIEVAAVGLGGSVLRLDRDGPAARTLYASQPCLRDAAFAAARLAAHMAAAGERLHDLNARLPRFSIARREVPITAGRGPLLRAMADDVPGCRSTGAGLRLRTGAGWVYVIPALRRPALRVMAECCDQELAEELCGFYSQKLNRLDRGLQPEK